MLAQSMTALVSHLRPICGLGNALLDIHPGNVLPAEAPGRAAAERRVLLRRVLAAAGRRMDIASLAASTSEAPTSYVQVSGAVRRVWVAKKMGLVQWQLAQVMDLASNGHWESALDHVALLMIMVEQTALDSGRTDLSWLLTLQPDLPHRWPTSAS